MDYENRMDTLISLLAQAGHTFKPWLGEISLTIVACSLIIFGSDINHFLRRLLSGKNIFIRTSAFILVNSFGYGLLLIKVSPWLTQQLSAMPSQWMFVSVITTFIVIGLWAQKTRHY
jgi:hypothetical protein